MHVMLCRNRVEDFSTWKEFSIPTPGRTATLAFT
jgi:hypothetical protein